VSQICQRAGLQVGMVSYCFGGKTQLLDALVERGIAEGAAELERLAAADLLPTQKLRTHVAGVIRMFWRFPYGSQLAERLRRGDGSAQHMSQVFAVPALAFYRQLLADGQERGEFRDVDPTFLLFTIIGACEFLFTARSWLEDAAGDAIDEELVARFTEHTIAVIERGIAA
jgi:AcrR family transcriptional regulator